MLKTSGLRRLLRHELAGPAAGCVPFVLAVEIASVSTSSVPIGHHWETTIAELNSAFPILHPLVAAVGAAVFVPFFRADQRALTETLPGRGLRPLCLRAGAAAGWMLAVHLGVCAAGLGWAWSRGTPGLPALWGILPGVGGILAWTGAGVLAAKVVPRWWIPPVLAVGGYLQLLFISDRVPTPFYSTGGATTDLYGLAYRSDVSVLQLVLGSFVYAAALALAAGSRRDLALTRLVSAALAVALIGSTVALATRGSQLYTAGTVHWRCDSGTPRLCVVREDAALLSRAGGRLRRAAAQLHDLDPDLELPATFREPVGEAWSPAAGEGWFDPEDPSPDQPVLDLLQSLSRCSQDWTDEQHRATDVVEAFAVPDSISRDEVGIPSRAEATHALAEVLTC